MLHIHSSQKEKLKTKMDISDAEIYQQDQSFLCVSLVLSAELRGDSSSSDHLSPSSPTAKIVSPSSDCLGGWLSIIGFGGTGDSCPLAPSYMSSGDRASSSSREPPKDAISKPSSS